MQASGSEGKSRIDIRRMQDLGFGKMIIDEAMVWEQRGLLSPESDSDDALTLAAIFEARKAEEFLELGVPVGVYTENLTSYKERHGFRLGEPYTEVNKETIVAMVLGAMGLNRMGNLLREIDRNGMKIDRATLFAKGFFDSEVDKVLEWEKEGKLELAVYNATPFGAMKFCKWAMGFCKGVCRRFPRFTLFIGRLMGLVSPKGEKKP
ncbi:MAG: hypothetical protein WC797_01545 [Candidatus Paceibacterota bacterium]